MFKQGEQTINSFATSRKTINLLLLVLTVLGTAACSTPGQYVESTGQFAKATSNLVDASNAYFDQVNYINFDTSLVSAEYSKTPISKETLQDPFFSNEDMAARRAMLATMRGYAASLAKIANDNLGEGFRTEVAGLKDDVLALQSDLEVASETKLKTLQNNTGFVSDVFGTIGKMIIEQKQADALADAILQADPAMRAAADLLDQDIQLITSKIRSERARQFGIAVDGINSELGRASLEQRLKLVGGVRPYGEQVLASRSIGSDFGAAQLYRSAQADMTAFAKAKRSPETLADLAASVDVFAERAGYLLALIRSDNIASIFGRRH